MNKVMMGNHALSWGARLVRAQVIAAYPITPQTDVVEILSTWCASGEMNARFITVESEHSAMAACIGAQAVGARAFTATSSQGLLLMHEVLHWAAGARLPIILGNINRAVAPPWNIWADQTDSLAQRDTGFLQFYCSSNQEVVDTVIQACRVAEQVMLPAMINLDAFVLSHTSERVDLPEPAAVDEYLPLYRPALKMDVDDPRAFGGLGRPEVYYELRYKIHAEMERAKHLIEAAGEEFERRFGRRYGLVEPYRMDGADFVLIASGTIASTARAAIDRLRDRGIQAGLLRVRVFRPFPRERLREWLAGRALAVVIDRNLSFGKGGIFHDEIQGALYGSPDMPPIFGCVAGLGGRDVTQDDIERLMTRAIQEKTPREPVYWWGLKP